MIAHDRAATSEVCYLNTHPFLNEDKSIALIHNGWIHNYEPIKKKLQDEGHVFTSKSVDSEILLHMYEKYGDDFVKQIKKDSSVWSKLNVILLKKDGTILAVSNGDLYQTKFEDGSVMVSTTGLFKDSKPIPNGEMLTIKDGKVLNKKKVFEPFGYTDWDRGESTHYHWDSRLQALVPDKRKEAFQATINGITVKDTGEDYGLGYSSNDWEMDELGHWQRKSQRRKLEKLEKDYKESHGNPMYA